MFAALLPIVSMPMAPVPRMSSVAIGLFAAKSAEAEAPLPPVTGQSELEYVFQKNS